MKMRRDAEWCWERLYLLRWRSFSLSLGTWNHHRHTASSVSHLLLRWSHSRNTSLHSPHEVKAGCAWTTPLFIFFIQRVINWSSAQVFVSLLRVYYHHLTNYQKASKHKLAPDTYMTITLRRNKRVEGHIPSEHTLIRHRAVICVLATHAFNWLPGKSGSHVKTSG